MEKPVTGLAKRMEELSRNNFEIPKIAFMPKTLDDVTQLFREAKNLPISRFFISMTGISMLCGESPPRRSYQRTQKRLVSFTS